MAARTMNDLEGWPPDAGSAYVGTFPPPEQVLIKEVFPAVGNVVTFKGKFNADDVPYTYNAPDRKTAKKVGIILKDNIGKTLLSVEKIEVPED